jgi:hypothetical protein
MKNDKFPVLFLICLVGIFFLDFFIHGHVLDANHDVREVIMPYHYMQSRALQSWIIPQWNPYVRCGAAFLGNPHNFFCYPPLTLAYFAPEKILPFAVTLILVLHVLAAGLFAYIFFKRIMGDRFWALLSSVIYLFSSSSVINMTVGISSFSFMVYVPLWLYLIYTQRERRFLPNLLLVTFVLSMFLFIGSFQRVIYAFWICFLFALFRSFRKKGQKVVFDPRPLLVSGLGAVMSFAITFIRLGPFMWNSRQGITAPGTFQKALTYAVIRPAAALRAFVPEFFGTKLHQDFFHWNLSNMNHLEMFNCYVGVAGILIFLYVFLFVWDRRLMFWKICAAGIFLVMFFPPVTFVHYLLTGRSMLNYSRIVWFFPLCAAVITGMFGSEYFESENSLKKLRWFSLTAFILVSAGIAVFFHGLLRRAILTPVQINTMRGSMVYFFCMGSLFVAGLFLLRKKTLKYFLLIFIAVDLLIIARIDSNNSHPFLSPDRELREYTDDEIWLAERFEQEGRSFRVITSDRPNLLENRCAELGFYSSCGHESFGSSYIARIYAGGYDLSRPRSFYVKNSPDLSNTSAINLSSSLFLMAPDRILVNRSEGVLPRTRLFKRYYVARDDRDAFEKVISRNHETRDVVVLDREPGLEISPGGDAGISGITRESNESIMINTDSPYNSVLLITDAYHAGWHAYVDGEPAEIMRANYAFKAVSVPAGEHKVQFVFEHPAFKASGAVSYAGILVFLLLCGIAFLRCRAERGISGGRGLR